MIKALILSLLLVGSAVTSIYDIKIKTINGEKIDFSSYKGKKILIVNIATESHFASQITGLEQLQQKYKDSLVVVAVPSNSFGKETKDEAGIKKKLAEGYKTSFLIAEKMDIKGSAKSSLYQWLTETNGRMKKEADGDFHKYLIDSKGELMGYFIPGVEPMSEIIQRAIEGKRTSEAPASN